VLIKSTRVILKKKYKSIIPLENGDSSSSSSPFLGPHKYTPFAPISPVLFPSGPKRKRTTQCMSELLSDKGGETGRACVHTGPERRHSKPERRERSSNRAGRGRGPGSLSLKTLEAVRHSGSPRPPRPMMNPSTTIPPASNWRATETLRAGPAVSCGAVRWLSKQPATAGGMAVPDYRQPSPRAPPRARPARLTSDQVVPVRRRRP
jgi:hypothetical protein